MNIDWVRTPEDLARSVEQLRGERAIAIDSESDSLHHHKEKVCLLQIGNRSGHVWLVDTLAFTDLSALAPLVADPSVVKVLHGADYDVTTLKRDFGFTFASIFDTGIAARFLGFPEVGLQAVLKRELGIEVSKDSQTADWSRRPLPPVQEAYAATDVLHLVEVWERLVAQLEEKGRLAWVIEECEAVAGLEAARRGRDPEAWQKVKHVRKLSKRQQGTLRELWAWRDRIAEETDIPSFKLASAEALVELATKPVKSAKEATAVKGLSPRVKSQGHRIMEALARGEALTDAELPALPSNPRPAPPSEAEKKRNDALRAWRTAEGTRLGLDISVVLPNRLLEKIAESGPRTTEALAAVPGIRRWRMETFGAELLRVVR